MAGPRPGPAGQHHPAWGVVVGLSPRTYGRRNPAGTLLALGGLLTWVDVLAAPQRRLVSRTRRPETAPTDAETREAVNEDLREMIDEIGETDTIEDEDREMMRSVVELGQTLVREVMVPRTDMVTIDAHKPASAAMRLFIRSGYSRVPVIGEDADDVRGILYLKDVLRRLAAHPEHEALAVAGFVREAEYVPETKPADDLLREMQTGRFHMALAVDEYGGTAGLVTMEDLLEESSASSPTSTTPSCPRSSKSPPAPTASPPDSPWTSSVSSSTSRSTTTTSTPSAACSPRPSDESPCPAPPETPRASTSRPRRPPAAAARSPLFSPRAPRPRRGHR